MKKIKRLQLVRNLVQLAFFGLLVTGLYFELRMVLIVFLPAALLFGNFFCGWICPYGFAQELFGMLGNILFKKKFKMPRAVQKYLQYVRYPLTVLVMVGVISLFYEYLNGYQAYLGMFMNGFVLTASTIVMLSFLVIAMLFERPFCNYLCTEGTKYGVASLARVFTIKRNEENCIGCKKCDKACPMNIKISDKKHVRNALCINCFECVSACPSKDTLVYGPLKRNKLKKSENAQ
jgi:polyferredoxin